MIADTFHKTLQNADAKRQADAIKAAPVRFVAKSAMFFRAQRVEAGETIVASVQEAIELFGSPRAELADPADLTRIRAHAAEAAAEHAKGARRNLPSWIKTGTQY